MVRRVIYAVGISLDGYLARNNGDVDFLFMPKDYPMAAFEETVDVAVMGRKTFEAALRLGGSFGTGTPGVVFSRSEPQGKRDGVEFVNERPADWIRELRNRPGKNIWLMGGGELAAAFLAEDLIDGLYLGVVPVLLGEGIPAFPAGFPQRDFTLTENHSYSKGLIGLTYERARRSGRKRRSVMHPARGTRDGHRG